MKMNIRRGLKRILVSSSVLAGIFCGVIAVVEFPCSDYNYASDEYYQKEVRRNKSQVEWKRKISRINTALDDFSDDDSLGKGDLEVRRIFWKESLQDACNINIDDVTDDYLIQNRERIIDELNARLTRLELERRALEVMEHPGEEPSFFIFLLWAILWFVIASIAAFIAAFSCSWIVLWWGGNLVYIFFRWIVLGFKSG